jgi:hypothetical protein
MMATITLLSFIPLMLDRPKCRLQYAAQRDDLAGLADLVIVGTKPE